MKEKKWICLKIAKNVSGKMADYDYFFCFAVLSLFGNEHMIVLE